MAYQQRPSRIAEFAGSTVLVHVFSKQKAPWPILPWYPVRFGRKVGQRADVSQLPLRRVPACCSEGFHNLRSRLQKSNAAGHFAASGKMIAWIACANSTAAR